MSLRSARPDADGLGGVSDGSASGDEGCEDVDLALANGQSGNEFAIVVAAGGVGYIGALLWLRWRR